MSQEHTLMPQPTASQILKCGTDTTCLQNLGLHQTPNTLPCSTPTEIVIAGSTAQLFTCNQGVERSIVYTTVRGGPSWTTRETAKSP